MTGGGKSLASPRAPGNIAGAGEDPDRYNRVSATPAVAPFTAPAAEAWNLEALNLS